MIKKCLKSLTLLAFVFGLGACANNYPAPTSMVAQAEESLAQAKNSGANASAPLAVKNAEDALGKAKAAMKDEEYKDAEQHLRTSLVESEYAIVKAEADKSKKAAAQLQESLDALRSETLKSSQ